MQAALEAALHYVPGNQSSGNTKGGTKGKLHEGLSTRNFDVRLVNLAKHRSLLAQGSIATVDAC